ncbi:MAG: carbonic anhydrase [Bradyrhizobium sp.]|uniref:carbonic anhydrase n=1 Tax=Bradyrhizobium sp. TaxID=376 RepID=UPI002715B0CA|nr:carbonic anhydrase [Bradyrhizobium sp.]MDO8397793.1 carbonic anhydrase [Bradyrhizobium sp.]
MITRRFFCGCLAGALQFAATAARAQTTECAVFTPDRQKSTAPDDAIARLKAGNERFTAGKSINCDLMAQVKETASSQSPYAAIVGCIDSRVAPELVFDQRIGDVFCARVAGNFVNTDIIGSLEYSVKVVGARAIVVLGHNSCGAIKAAVDNVKLGNITAMLKNFQPALATLTKADGHRDSHNYPLVQKVAEASARLTAESLPRRSPIIKALVDAKQLKIVAAMHDITTGKVSWLS